MSDVQKALYLTFKPIIFGAILGTSIYYFIHYFSLLTLSIILSGGIAVYLTYLVYKMNLDTVRRERNESEQKTIIDYN